MARVLAAAVLACLLAAPAADGRVVVATTGGPSVALIDVGTGAVQTVTVGGRSEAVAVAPDGSRAFVATGRRVVAVDLVTRAVLAGPTLPAPVTALAVTPDGANVLAARRGAIDTLDPLTLAPAARIALGRAAPRALAVDAAGARAAVAFHRRAGIVSLAAGRLTLTRRLRPLGGVAWGPTSAWFTERAGAVVGLGALTGRVRRRIALGRGLGGGIAVSPIASRAVVGASGPGREAGVVDLAAGRLLARVPTGRGPGLPAFSADGSRVYVANRGHPTTSILSGYTYRRLGAARLRARAVAVQPGLALIAGTEGPDRLFGTRDDDRLDGLGGDDALNGFRRNDVILGGPGNDAIVGGGGSDLLDGGDGDDRFSAMSGVDVIKGGAGDDNANAGTGNDGVDGGPGNDYLDGGDGIDTVLGGEGDDKINEVGLGPDLLLDGGPGHDFVYGGRAPDTIAGGDGDDT
ncbi:MAG TPA: hypothetical protein VHF89_04560, partial [Solirubrobacteraceae bacterium]|nr:hypothetical protein [Solirubrobacteraceae bacterium]